MGIEARDVLGLEFGQMSVIVCRAKISYAACTADFSD